MEYFKVNGGARLSGVINLSGAKNVAIKACFVSLLTDDQIKLHNIPHIKDVYIMLKLLESLGIKSDFHQNTLTLKRTRKKMSKIPFELGSRLRTSSLLFGPLLARFNKAIVPNPGGCRIGARPIDRHVKALKKMKAKIKYNSEDGYFYAFTDQLIGTEINFPKNTHTGTETVILAAALAKGTTIINNAAEEIEIDDLIALLNSMGAKIKRQQRRKIEIIGVDKLHGSEYTIMGDRNEEVTFAIAAYITGGEIKVLNSQRKHLDAFMSKLNKSGLTWVNNNANTTTYKATGKILPSKVITRPFPGFMTDWQAPWAILMTKAQGTSIIHETIFENRFTYVDELKKMGADIDFFTPIVKNKNKFYNFNWSKSVNTDRQAVKITGPVKLHNAALTISDLRAGATLLLAALTANGESVISGIDQIDRGYEHIELKLKKLGADIVRVKEREI